MRDRVRDWLRAAYGIAEETLRRGGQNDVALFASAMAYALTLALAPLTLALGMLGAGAVASRIAPDSPLSGTRLTVAQVAPAGWAGPLASVIAGVLVIWGGAALFTQFVAAIDRIWAQPAVKTAGGWRAFVRARLLSLALLVVMAIALALSAAAGTALAALSRSVAGGFGSVAVAGWITALARGRIAVDALFAWVLYTVAFTVVPSPRPRIRDVLSGSLVTAFAYALGQAGLAWYLGHAARFDALGAFGGFLGFLVWAYYTSFIVLWGAQLTAVLARRAVERRSAAGGDSSISAEA